MFLYTNIESRHHLDRIAPELLRLNHRHLLVVIFFKNAELEDYALGKAKDTHEIYTRVSAQQMLNEKNLIIQMLEQWGINTLYTRPEDLTLSTINKYIELKARGLI